jgi:biotin-(acetyl-CoA carboxylase) ligase
MDKLTLPPLLNAVRTRSPYETAIELVRQRQAGAGDLFWFHHKGRVNIAIVLEPEVNRKRALEMLPLVMVALSDCLAVLLPPQVAVQFRECREIIVNGGVAGNIKSAISKVHKETDVPDWIVLAIKVRLNREETDEEPGLQPDVTTLDEEGWEDVSQIRFIETFARHFLSWLAAWDDNGFATVARAWKFKAEDEMDPDMKLIGNAVTIFDSNM